jgi:hypothetical protein
VYVQLFVRINLANQHYGEVRMKFHYTLSIWQIPESE